MKRATIGKFKFTLGELIILSCLIWIGIIGVKSAKFQKLVPDANLYMDVARHINRGDGFILSLNIRQAWVGNNRQALTYQQPIYSAILSLLRFDEHVVFKAVLLNVIFSLATISLLFLAWRKLLRDWIVALSILPFALSKSFYEVYSTPLSEPFSMLVLSAAFLFFLSSEKYKTLSGFLFGLAFLARFSNIFGIVGLLLVLAIEAKSDIKGFLKFLIALVLPILIFEIVGFLLTGEWHPSYAQEAKVFRMTREHGGAIYQNSYPALLFSAKITPKIFFLMLYHNVSSHLLHMLSSIGWLTFILSIVGLFAIRKMKDGWKLYAVFMFAIANLVMFSFAFYFSNFTEADRYSLPSFALLLPMSALGIKEISRWFSLSRNTERIVASLIFIFLATIQGWKTYIKFFEEKTQFTNPIVKEVYFNQPVEWINKHTSKDELIATNYYQVPFIFDRPVVCLPINKQLTRTNLKAFLLIHKPKAILIDLGNYQQPEWQNPIYQKILEEMEYKLVDLNERFVFYVKYTK